ncbi:hypothetical protein CERZMDRAFT_95741 [Cercospora zeae-maydis SCOH1-5]|uniref:Uncharacterized protein n=1 Tax=Cercospora zeae-maydis SCOH1-5 TaxID=717836 RepID=A0A6A6FM05_9PEZI|nr:hypothetical protein CERZMDRAFT_95741 [Cercospora zeae-maydis SCOH1-5]
MKFCSLILAAAAAAVSAAMVPPPGLQPRQATAFCGTVASRCTGSSRQAQLTTYCSSYLGIPRVTSTRTITVATARPTTTLTVRVVGTTTVLTTINVTRTISATSTTNVAPVVATVTTTQTTTSFSTRTTSVTRTSVTRTMTVQAPDVTQIVSKCAAPPNPNAAITIMRVGSEFSPKKGKREAGAEAEADGDSHGILLAKDLVQRQAVAKPSCLERYTSASRQSSACSCASIRPSTTTATRPITATSTVTSTLRLTTSTSTITSQVTNTVATVTQFITTQTITRQTTSTSIIQRTVTSTINGPSVTVVNNVVSTRVLPPKSTAYSLSGPAAQPTFYIQNDQLNYAILRTPSSSSSSDPNFLPQRSKKSKRDVAGTIIFDSIIPASTAQLFSLPLYPSSQLQQFHNISGPLTSPDQSLCAAESIEFSSSPGDDGQGFDDIDVQFVTPHEIASGAFGAVSCAMTAGPRGTCPLKCWFNAPGPERSGDVSQGNPFGNWMLGQPGASGSDEVWGVWAVTP